MPLGGPLPLPVELPIDVIDLGRMDYASAYRVQAAALESVLASRASPAPVLGRIHLVEHDPVITVSRRPTARMNLVASAETLARAGVSVAETDRGGDITYHGPGQLVVYPVLDLNALRLNLHAYMRLLEEAVIETCRRFGVQAGRDPSATGVWVGTAKICAMGVRVKRWITMHGLALNVTTNLSHFDLIVPCGLAGRSVTSLQRELGDACPEMSEVKRTLADALLHLAAKQVEAVGTESA